MKLAERVQLRPRIDSAPARLEVWPEYRAIAAESSHY
ncbi:MAG: hypothetical protein QOD02_3368 [Mycobacterium sp.]|jgi:hypothetical protein|nr:hypothetical protein [Mycobacterium sp.]